MLKRLVLLLVMVLAFTFSITTVYADDEIELYDIEESETDSAIETDIDLSGYSVGEFKATASIDRVDLSWELTGNENTEYRLLVRRSDGVQRQFACLAYDQTSYTDFDAEPGVKTKYWICVKHNSSRSGYVSCEGLRIKKPAAPVEGTSKRSFNHTDTTLVWSNTISWQPVGKQDGFAIWKKIGSKAYEFVKYTEKISWKDTKPSQAYVTTYKIKSYKKDGYGKKIFSDGQLVIKTSRYMCKPVSSQDFTAVSTASGSKISWKPVTYANGYLIYKRTGTKDAYAQVGKTSACTYWIDQNTSCDVYDYYKVYPYYTTASGKCVVNDKTDLFVKSKHSFKAATYKAPKKCTKCGLTVGNKLIRKVLIIGDSRMKYMGITNLPGTSDFIWLAESGATTGFVNAKMVGGKPEITTKLGTFVKDSFINTLTGQRGNETVDVLGEIKRQDISDVIYALGVNNLATDAGMNAGVNQALSTMKMIDEYTDCTVHYMSILPVKDGMTVYTNSRVLRFNQDVKKGIEGTDIKYLDAYDKVNLKDTVDGVHYNIYAVKYLFDYIHQLFY